MTLLYDGSYEGLLNCIEFAIQEKTMPRIKNIKNHQITIFDDEKIIKSNYPKAIKFNETIRDKISPLTSKNIFGAYLSEKDNIEDSILSYIRKGFELGSSINNLLTDDNVHEIQDFSRKVFGESHRLKGLIRFRQVEPLYNVISLVSRHFERRLKNENWIIYDARRNIAALYRKKDCIFTSVHINSTLIFKNTDTFMEELWKEYFRIIAIDERKNEKLQMHFMPKRYWKHLPEKN